MKPAWTYGNQIELLESGEEYFPALLQALDAAHEEILFESYIFDCDTIGQKVLQSLKAAAIRGVRVHLAIDGYGDGLRR